MKIRQSATGTERGRGDFRLGTNAEFTLKDRNWIGKEWGGFDIRTEVGGNSLPREARQQQGHAGGREEPRSLFTQHARGSRRGGGKGRRRQTTAPLNKRRRS